MPSKIYVCTISVMYTSANNALLQNISSWKEWNLISWARKWVCFMNDINSSFFFGGVYKIAVSYQYFLLTIKLIKSNISKLWPKLYQRCAPCNGKSSFGLWPGEIRNWSGTKLNIFSPGASWASKYFFYRGPAESLGAQPVFMPININPICNMLNFFSK
jgi:hypothetical protein